jgi:hypothetical protein
VTLTLLPITAILLLLSGMGTPTRAAGYQATIAALGRQWRVNGGTAPHRASALAQGIRAHAAPFGQQPPAADRRTADEASVRVARTGPATSGRKLFRTRFGFADGAYLALGPPASGL